MVMTEAQKRAQKKYKAKTRDKQRYWSDKSAAKSFIKRASKEELEKIKKLISNREEELK